MLSPASSWFVSFLGKNECLKDKTIRDAVLAPPRGDPVPIKKFDKAVLVAAFSLRPGPIPGVMHIYLSIYYLFY